MEHDSKAYLFDIKQSCEKIENFVKDIDFEKYCSDSLIKAGVERKFLVIGEALTRLRREFPEIINEISDYQKVIGLRNVLVHGYDIINDATVWSAIKDNLPKLYQEVSKLIND
jgi:uncharacterized protein with HEPN domain